MSTGSPDGISSKRKDFICGVVEGFYGRPWTTEQRKDLFQKLKKWNMDMYVYAPKDDYKHRAYWRELYTVEEAEHLTSLITAARAQGITFCYALSPGLDITYSNQKEITALKRKLEQVSQFGCTCFALLFDDIEPEMSEADKQTFQSFAHAQVSVTNEIHQHLGSPRFLLCPTQYCSTRAVPTVSTSEYLTTLGTTLEQQIDIMWTGPKVISKTLTVECIQEITQVLRRPPVIWDNLHANDYDQKRIFLGPYCGRSPELIPLLRGVLTNPNCEYNANMVAIRTLAHWAGCSLDAPAHMDSVSWDIKLERESEQGVCEDEAPAAINRGVYHPRQALRQAIAEWLPEFSIPKMAQGPIIKPQQQVVVPPVPIIPILPSVNTCMSLVTSCSNTCTTSTCDMHAHVPTVSTSQLRASAGACAGVSAIESLNPVSNPVMNSLVSPTKVVLNELIPNPIIPIASSNMTLPAQLPVSTLPVPLLGLKALETDRVEQKEAVPGELDSLVNESVLEGEGFVEELRRVRELDADDMEEAEKEESAQNGGGMSVEGTPPDRALSPPESEHLDIEVPHTDVNMNDAASESGSMQVEPSHSPLSVSTEMMVEPSEQVEPVEEPIEDAPDNNAMTTEDLVLLCDLFYLPFAYGSRGLRLLTDYHWLATHAGAPTKPEMSEWRRRRCRFAWWCARARRLLRRLCAAQNRELYCELQPYVWELCACLQLLQGVVRWLELGKFPAKVSTNNQGSYTWFSKGWREAFESGAQEPWVFRGGLTADLRRLLPVESSAETVRVLASAAPPHQLRVYTAADEADVCKICHQTCRDGADCSELFPEDLQGLPADRLVEPFLALHPEFCILLEEDSEGVTETDTPDDEGDAERLAISRSNGVDAKIVGYACAAPNSKEFYKRQEVAWIPAMCEKYPLSLCERDDLSRAAKECIRYFHTFSTCARAPDSVSRAHPALLACCVPRDAGDAGGDVHAPARLLACLGAALRASGVTGVHVCINSTDHYLHQFYTKQGFVELASEADSGRVYLGRTF